MKTNILSQTSSCGSSRLESVRKALPGEDPRHTLPHLEMPSHQIIPPPTPPPEPDYDAYFHSNSSRLSPTSYHHQLYPHHTSSGGSGASSPSTSSRPRSSASARHAEVTLLVDSDDDGHPHPFGLLPHHSTPRRSFSHRHPPPTSTPASSVASSSHLTTSSTGSSSFSSAISLATILEVFQHNINQSQAWALIFQTVQSLSHLLSDCEQQQNTTTECSSYLSSVSGDGIVELVELKSTADLQLDAVSGAVHPSTWSTTRGHLKKVPIKGPASVNLVVAHFAGIIYKALTFGITEDAETKQSSRCQIPERKILETNLDSETDEDDEDHEDDDQEIVLESDLEQLLITMIASKDDEVAELTCTSASAVDEGIVDIDDEDRLLSALSRSIIPQVVERCVEHFERLWKELLGAGVATSNGDLKTTNATSGSESCPILMMLYENRNHQDVIINAEVYYRSILEQMLDEFGKLKQLLKQLCEVRDDVMDGGGSSSGGHRRQLRNLNETPNTESLKVWAQTWIKVMSELRFGGVHLKHTNRDEVDPRMKPILPTPTSAVQPFNALMEQIRGMSRDQLRPSSRSSSSRYLQHSKSLPLLDYRLTINREVIQEQKKSLKPASRRTIPEKPPEEPSLHERLMREVKAGRKLSSVTPEVKPNIAKLFWKEKAEIQKRRVAQSKSFPRIKSTFYLTQPPPVAMMAVDRFFESDESDQFTMDYDNDLLTDSTSSLCRCSSVNSNHAHTRGGRGQVEEAAMVTPPKADVGSSFLRRFRSLSVHKLSKHGPGKRKNQAADDSFNTSLPRTPEHHASTPYVSNPIQVSSSQSSKDRRYMKKKSRGQLFPEDSLLSTSYPSPPSALTHSHSSIPPQWMTKPTATGYRPISFPSASSLVSTTTSTPRSCQRHNPRGSNPSFVHSFQSPCTCPSGLSILSSSPLGSTTSINHQMTSPPPPPPSLFTQNAYRRSYIKKTPPVFDRLAFGSMRRSNSVMFSGSASTTKERANSGSSTASKASKWSIGNLFAKLVPSAFAASSNSNNNTSPSKMKRE